MKFTLKFLFIFIFTNIAFGQIDGQIDSTFGINGITFSNFLQGATGTSIGIDNQQNIIAVGQIYTSNQYDFAAIKFNSQGNIDTTFASNGKFTIGFGIDDFCNSILVQSDNKIIMGGYSSNWDGFNVNSIFTQFSLVRIHNNGIIDSTFGNNGKFELDFDPVDCGAVVLEMQSDGKIIAIGKYNNGASLQIIAIRIDQNGVLDLSFGNSGISKIQIDTILKDDEVTSCVIQADNKILIGVVTIDQSFSGKIFGLVRLTENGILDSSFGSNGVVKIDIPNQGNDFALAIALQGDGKILQAGTCKNSKIMAICRFNNDGTLDPTFGAQGIDTLNISVGKDIIRDIMIQDDNKIIIVGESNNNACILRLSQFGKIDSTFNNIGINNYGSSLGEGFYDVHSISSNKLVTAAYAQDTNNLFQLSVAAYSSILFSGIKQNEPDNLHLNLYPNPANDILNINYTLTTNNRYQIQIINSIGQVVKEVSNQNTVGTYTWTVDTKNYSKGIYCVSFSNGITTKQAKLIIN